MVSIPFALTLTAGSSVDGSAGAPAGTPQLPALLNGYLARPPWKVAGVDYAVGIHSGVALKVPSASNIPAGCDYRANEHAIYVQGKNVVLSGYNLTGATVLVTDAATGTVTVTDCSATSSVNIRSTVGATAKLSVTYCTFDGGGTASDSNFQTIQVFCPLTVRYCSIKNSPAATFCQAPSTIQYNLFSGFAWVTGAHANATYFGGGGAATDSILLSYNTIWGGGPRNAAGFPIGIGAGVAFFTDGGDYHNPVMSNNVVISNLPGGASYLMGFYANVGNSVIGGVAKDNYLAAAGGFNGNGGTGAFGPFYLGSTGPVQATYSGNIDMNTGKVVG